MQSETLGLGLAARQFFLLIFLVSARHELYRSPFVFVHQAIRHAL